ncbi:hypothetical protein, partial [Micromonospora sp. NPDC003776]
MPVAHQDDHSPAAAGRLPAAGQGGRVSHPTVRRPVTGHQPALAGGMIDRCDYDTPSPFSPRPGCSSP